MLRHDTETIWIFGLSADQISVTKRCDCIVTGRYDSRTAPDALVADAAVAAADLPVQTVRLELELARAPISDGLKA